MNRISLGTDIFSPIQFDGANDNMFADGNGSFSDFPPNPLPTGSRANSETTVNSLELKSREKKGKMCSVVETPQNHRERQHSQRRSDIFSPLNSNDVFTPLDLKDVNENFEDSESKRVPKKKSSLNTGAAVQKRQSKSRNSQSTSDKTSSAHVMKRKEKDILSNNFVTVRSERHKTYQPSEQPKRNSKTVADSEKVAIQKVKISSSTLGVLCDTDRTIMNHHSTSSDLTLVVEEPSLAEPSVTNLQCPLQEVTPAVEHKEMLSSSVDVIRKSEENIFPSQTCAPCIVSEPIQTAQIQSSIIEKLIRETVSFEIDGIRQVLFDQHLSLVRHLNTRMDEFQKNVNDKVDNGGNNERLYGIIEELLFENMRLRNIVSQKNNF